MTEIPLRQLLGESEVLPESFYRRPAVDVAKDVLGKVLVHGRTAGMIVETEAYLGGDDLASHSARGLTDRTRVIFGPPGRAYVYLIYGMYECLNFVVEPEGHAGCVLIRALEPVSGFKAMFERRSAARKPEDLASGPGKLTRALDITRKLNGCSLTKSPLVVRDWSRQPGIDVVTTTRIGITHCADWPLRYYIRGNSFVSKK
jgi:DNA-3-methyladenine glycosylase